jgi:hypothetical protein
VSCPVCGQTMQNLGTPERRVFWCAGCGTLKEETGDFSKVEMPASLRQVVAAANAFPGRADVRLHAAVKAVFKVDQIGGDIPTVKMEIALKMEITR